VQYLIILAILGLVAVFLTAPLRRPPDPATSAGTSSASRLDDLEAAREAKYREIRDAELDHRTGKLSDADYAELDRTLRAEAIEILRELDRARQAR
jgi:hypothetical protein